MSSFRLTDMEKKTLTQQNQIAQINEYGWRNLNILRLNPSKNYEVGDSEITFQLDSSQLGSNVPINRIQMEIEYEVIATSGEFGLSGIPVYGALNLYNPVPATPTPWTKYGYVFPANTVYNGTDPWIQDASNNFAPYLTSVSNGGLDAFVGNKSFSNVKLKNGSNELREDKRTPEKIDIMTRMLDHKKMEYEGVYPDWIKGRPFDKAGGDAELLPLYHLPVGDPADAPIDQWNSEADVRFSKSFCKGCSPDDLRDNIFWKRNTNNQYIEYDNETYFQRPDDNAPVWVAGIDPVPNSAVLTDLAPIKDIFLLTERTGDKIYWYQTVPDATYFSTGPQIANPTTDPTTYFRVAQRSSMTVTEDLFSDILTTRYNKNEQYRPLPATQLNLTFTISPLLNSLYKTSNANIANVQVVIKSMKLNIFTFNYGLLNIEPSTYYVPYFQEKADIQQLQLEINDNIPAETSTPKIQVLKYNKMPTYILFYASENLISTERGSTYQNLNTVPMTRIRLRMNNDHGTSLYNMTIREMQDATTKNLGKEFYNYYSLFRANQSNPCKGLIEAVAGWKTNQFPFGTENKWRMTESTWRLLTNSMGELVSQPMLDGVYLLKIGEDIRIDNEMTASLNTPVSMEWEIDFDTNYYTQTTGTINFNTVALFPAYYIMNPSQGLIKSQDITISNDDFWTMLKNTNDNIDKQRTGDNNIHYGNEFPNMMFGSGWFSNIVGSVANSLPLIRNIASTVGNVASMIPHPLAQAVGSVGKAIGGRKTVRKSSKKPKKTKK